VRKKRLKEKKKPGMQVSQNNWETAATAFLVTYKNGNKNTGGRKRGKEKGRGGPWRRCGKETESQAIGDENTPVAPTKNTHLKHRETLRTFTRTEEGDSSVIHRPE